MENRAYPLLFEPALKNYIWGGRNLARLGRVLPPEGVVAESWEIAAHEDGTTTVTNGRFTGMPLTAVHAELGLDLVGARNAWAEARGKFPLLVKIIDAAQPLSVQVHPDDDYALAHEGNELGKTEMWYVLHAEPGAEVVLGVTAGTTREAFARALHDGRLEPHLHRVPVHTGDHVCVPAGTLHAIMSGLIMAEVQQNSNTTYRVYDWGRTGADGKPRPLHVANALDVIDFDNVEPGVCRRDQFPAKSGYRRELLCRNRYFTAERVELAPGTTFRGHCDGATMEIWGVLAGSVTLSYGEAAINSETFAAVRFILLPAILGAFTFSSRTGATLLRSYTEDMPAA